MLLSAILVTVYLCVYILASEPNGWHMTDRFYGFRYEIYESGVNDHKDEIRDYADKLGCFGWIQDSSINNNLVGEARCVKRHGKDFENWLRIKYDNKLHVKLYEDTKIRLHFTSFKILDSSRDTCFLDKPHQCINPHMESDLSSASNMKSNSDEL